MRCSIQLAERPHIVRIRASFTSSMRTRGEEQQFSIREEQMPVVGKGPEIDKSALIIVDMQNDFVHRDGSFSHIAREHPEAKIDMPFLIGTIPLSKDWRMRSGQPEDRSCTLR